MNCNYCGRVAQRATGRQVYPYISKLWHKQFLVCWHCDARIGLSRDGKPMGTLANHELRQARMWAHKRFDNLWKTNQMTRTEAYAWLAETLDIEPKKCHMAQFNIITCLRVILAVIEREET